MSTIPRIDEIAVPPMVGMKYLVPTVLYPWLGRVEPWPIMGPKHEDAEHLRFGAWHYHIDLRFLTKCQERSARRVYGRPIMVAVAAHPLWHRGEGNETLPHPEPVWMPLTCRRADHFYPHKYAFESPAGPRFEAFHRAYHGRKCPRNAAGLLVCPHKGFVLGSLKPDILGHVVCPLHGLRIDVNAEAVVSEVGP